MVLSGSSDATLHYIGVFRRVPPSMCLSELRGEYLPDLCRPLFYDYRLRLVRKMMSGECRRRDKGVFLSRGRLLASVHHEDIR